MKSSTASLTISSDRKSSTLVLPQVTLRDTAVYYCVLREAHWDRWGCTCAASLVGRSGDRVVSLRVTWGRTKVLDFLSEAMVREAVLLFTVPRKP